MIMDTDRLEKRINITSEVLNKIAEIDRIKGQWKGGLKISPQILGRLKTSVIITSSGASTRIEGSKLSDAEVTRLLRGLKTNLPRNRDEQEVAGYADLLGRIFDNYSDLKLTENNILHFHSILLSFSDKDISHRGKYKMTDNKVIIQNDAGQTAVLFEATKPYLVKPEMDVLLPWVEESLVSGTMHPLLVIASFVFEFLAIHPFLDGNGRLSRSLTNLLLLRAGYPYIPYVSLDEIIEDTKDQYYLALGETQKTYKTRTEDLSPWLNYLLDSLLVQGHKAIDLMENEKSEKLLSENQRMVLALFDENESLSVSEIDSLLKREVPLPTLKQLLARLSSLGLIEKIGQGRATKYRIV
jgi:Fic family protein